MCIGRLRIVHLVAVAALGLSLFLLSATVTPLYGQTRSGPADQVLVAIQPGDSVAGSPVGGPPTVRVVDAAGNPVANVVVRASLDREASLGGSTLRHTGSDGTAVFDDLVIDVPGSDYQITFTARNLSVVTDPFEVLSAGAGPVAGGSVVSQQFAVGEATVTLTAVDAAGRHVGGLGASDFAISADDCASATPLARDPRWTDFTEQAGSYTVLFHEETGLYTYDFCADVTGVNLQIGDDRQLTLAEPRPTTLVLLNEPMTTVAGAHISSSTGAIRVKVRNQFGHAMADQTISASASDVSASGEWLQQRQGGTAAPEATTGNTGIATFIDDRSTTDRSALVITDAGVYTLTFTVGGATVRTSEFEITAGTPTTLTPSAVDDARAGQALSQPSTDPVSVEVRNEHNVAIAGTAVTVTLVDEGGIGAVLGGTLTVPTGSDGIAAFPDLTVSEPGTYRLRFAVEGVSAQTNEFTISPN